MVLSWGFGRVVVVVVMAPHFVPTLVIHSSSPAQFDIGATVSRKCITNVPRHQILGTESGTSATIIIFIKIEFIGLFIGPKVHTLRTDI